MLICYVNIIVKFSKFDNKNNCETSVWHILYSIYECWVYSILVFLHLVQLNVNDLFSYNVFILHTTRQMKTTYFIVLYLIHTFLNQKLNMNHEFILHLWILWKIIRSFVPDI